MIRAPQPLIQRAEAVAITTYSGLFNINPSLNDANIIICDDAHAGEEFIAGLWSLHVARSNHPLLFQGLVDLLEMQSRRRCVGGSGVRILTTTPWISSRLRSIRPPSVTSRCTCDKHC